MDEAPNPAGVPDHELRSVLASAWPDRSISPDRLSWHNLGAAAASSATGQLWRVRAENDGAPGGLVLKVLRHSTDGHKYWLSSDVVTEPMYWRREAEVYASGLLTALGGPLKGPAVHGVHQRADGTVSLWLQEIIGVPGAEWPIRRYEVTAEHVAVMQARFLADQPVPTYDWLARRWLRTYLDRRYDELSAPSLYPTGHPLLRSCLTPAAVRTARAAWEAREAVLAALENLPPVLCHTDFWPRNLFATDDDTTTTAIDWAYVGIGAPGEDAGNLSPDSMLDMFVDPRTHAEQLHDRILDGYLRGLGDAAVDEHEVRFAMDATSVLKYCWVGPRLIGMVDDPVTLVHSAEEFGLEVTEFVERRAALVEHLAQLTADVLRRATRLG